LCFPDTTRITTMVQSTPCWGRIQSNSIFKKKEEKTTSHYILLFFYSQNQLCFGMANKKKVALASFLSSSICSLSFSNNGFKSSDLPLLSCLSRQGLLCFGAFVGCGFGLYQLGSDNLLGRVFVPC